MALSEPVKREPMHMRRIEVQGFLREDGLLDVDARLVDTKPYTFANDESGEVPAGRPLHEMLVRMTVDDRLTIVACEAVTLHSPYANCGGGAENMGALVGLALKAGFLKAANERLRGPLGCTHIREMLQQIGTVAHQTMWPVRERARARALAEAQRRDPSLVVRADAGEEDGSTSQVNTCFAYSSAGPVVRKRWPHLYTANQQAGDHGKAEPPAGSALAKEGAPAG